MFRIGRENRGKVSGRERYQAGKASGREIVCREHVSGIKSYLSSRPS